MFGVAPFRSRRPKLLIEWHVYVFCVGPVLLYYLNVKESVGVFIYVQDYR